MDLTQLIGEFGLPIALIVVLLMRDFRREKLAEKEKKYLLGRIENVEAYQRDMLQKTVERATEAISEHNVVISHCRGAM